MPAGVRKPKQKPGAEGTVENIATVVIAKLRNRVFHDFPTLQKAVTDALVSYNREPFQKREGSRELVHAEEREFLRSLPAVPFEVASWEYNRKVYTNTLYYNGRGMDRNKILSLATGNYISTCRNSIINGYTGSGKTHLACAFGKRPAAGSTVPGIIECPDYWKN